MSLVKWTFVVLVLLPAAEIAAFALVALLVGVLWASLLFVATSLLGLCLLRWSGRSDFDRLRGALKQEGLLAVHLETPGAAALLGGILLVFPGFITDFLGLFLFLPPFRRWAARALKKTFRKAQRRRDGTTVIDLQPEEWQQIPDRRPKRAPSSKDQA